MTFSTHHRSLCLMVAGLLFLWTPLPSANAEPVFELAFAGPEVVTGTPGATIQIPVIVQLISTPDPALPNEGVEAWALSISSDPVSIISV